MVQPLEMVGKQKNGRGEVRTKTFKRPEHRRIAALLRGGVSLHPPGVF